MTFTKTHDSVLQNANAVDEAGYVTPASEYSMKGGANTPLPIVEHIFGYACGDPRGWEVMGNMSKWLNWYYNLTDCEGGALTISLHGRPLRIASFLDVDYDVLMKAMWYQRVWLTLTENFIEPSNWAFGQLADIAVRDHSVGVFFTPGIKYLMPREEEYKAIVSRERGCRFKYTSRMCDTASRKRTLLIALKAELFRRILMGKVTVAMNHSLPIQIFDQQLKFFEYLLNPVSVIVGYLTQIISTFAEVVTGSIDWWFVWNFICFCWTLWLMWCGLKIAFHPVNWVCSGLLHYFRVLFNGYQVAKLSVKEMEKDCLVSTEVTEKGVVYHVIVAGEHKYLLPRASETRREEMAMPGSLLCASGPRPIGAIMVASEGTELALVGCFWRYNDYLVTAKHVANVVATGLANVYLVGYEPTKRGSTILDMRNVHLVERSVFQMDNNLFSCDTLDVFGISLGLNLWAKLKINKLSVKKPSLHGQTVNSVGWVNGVLMTGGGKTIPAKSFMELHHTASTNKGFSGSPVFSGSSVVGMHIAGQSDYNVAIRIETILHFLPSNESNNPDEKEYKDSIKWFGENMDIREEHGVFVGRNSRGATKFLTEDELERYGYDMTDKVRSSDVFNPVDFKSKTGQNWSDYDDDDNYVIHRRRRNENASIPTRTVRDVTKIHKYYKQKENVTAVHCGKVPAVNTEVLDYFNSKKESIAKLGYIEGEQTWPEINPTIEQISLEKHLELFGRRNDKCSEPPTVKERLRLRNLLVRAMEHNRYEPRTGYKQPENIRRIINSNLVDEKKSAGAPYQGEGMPTNRDVLAKLGEQGLVERVLGDWDADFLYKVFLKADPTKKKKLKEGMARIITGLPLHKMVKHQALFREMLETAVENWKDSPMKYAFSPGKPGHPEHLDELFEGKSVYECDKSNWDFNMFGFFFDIGADVIKDLAVRPHDMSEEEFDQYLHDVQQSIDEVKSMGLYSCTNGNTFKSNFDGCMKSGWLLTIFLNSLSQIALDYLIKMRLGLTDDEIFSHKYEMMAGGDDTLQTFPDGFDLEKYKVEGHLLGFELDFKIHKSFDGCEYFSTVFSKDQTGVIKYMPVRFTKHIEKMSRVKSDDLSMALSSAMINYCWDAKRFKFFENMYKNFRKMSPSKFPLHLCKSAVFLQYRSKGCESYRTDIFTEEMNDLDSYLSGLIN